MRDTEHTDGITALSRNTQPHGYPEPDLIKPPDLLRGCGETTIRVSLGHDDQDGVLDSCGQTLEIAHGPVQFADIVLRAGNL